MPVFETNFSKPKPKKLIHRDYKTFDEEYFHQELCRKMSTELIYGYISLENVFIDVLNKHALIKKKHHV